jgi:serine/threonine protein phosphatase 1
MRELACSDIHGCLKSFQALLWDQFRLTPEDKLYILGDYIDRGPDSKGVLDQIVELREKGYQVFTLRGNHDDIFLRLCETQDKEAALNWEVFGGTETLVSFGVFDEETNGEPKLGLVPKHYLDLISEMPLYLETDKFIFAHAGINTVRENIFEDTVSLMWARGWYDDMHTEKLDGRIIIHGHTPTKRSKLQQWFDKMPKPVMNIDCGCCYPHKEDMGYLCGLDLTNWEIYFQKNVDDMQVEFH